MGLFSCFLSGLSWSGLVALAVVCFVWFGIAVFWSGLSWSILVDFIIRLPPTPSTPLAELGWERREEKGDAVKPFPAISLPAYCVAGGREDGGHEYGAGI